MKKRIRKIIMIVLLLIFTGSCGVIGVTLWQYEKASRLYDGISSQYTALIVPKDRRNTAAGSEKMEETAPIVVDFEALQKVNKDVIGWIYCEDTVIDYPILQGSDNDYYLNHSIDGAYSASGSIFVEASNRGDFLDFNTILYGHHMKNKTMFATLSYWSDQKYYEEHPVMWILTPQRDYKVELFSAYTTAASSDTYQIFQKSGEDFTKYLTDTLNQSEFQTNAAPGQEDRCVLLSTCAYVFDNARDVLHGKLIPVNSAGGVSIGGE